LRAPKLLDFGWESNYYAIGCMKQDSRYPRQVKTISDIARLAGVSTATVSRALSDSPLISRETKEKVRAIAEKHRFQLNMPARRLSMKRSNTVAFVTHGRCGTFSVTELFILELISGVSAALHEEGYDLLLLTVDPADDSWAVQHLSSGKADGFILMTSTRKRNHITSLAEADAPFIAFGPPLPGMEYSTVAGDDEAGGRIATERLAAAGRRRIAFLGGPEQEAEVRMRRAGYEAALRKAGRALDPALVDYGDFTGPGGANAMVRLLRSAPDLDAVFAASDVMAVSAMRVLAEAGKRIPADVSVIGYDGLSIGEQCSPPLTTVSQNLPLVGKLLAQNLIQRIATGAVSHSIVPVSLIERASV